MPHSDNPVDKVPIKDSDDVTSHERGDSSRGQGSPDPRSRDQIQATVKTWAAVISALAAVVMAVAAVVALKATQRGDNPAFPGVTASPEVKDQSE
jgi:hypothetical protein